MNDFSNKGTEPFQTKTGAFCKGGFGCVFILAAFALLCLVHPNGNVRGEPWAFLLLFLFVFLIGGFFGLFARWFYK